ncbi:hypothetical protein B0A52_05071 [Exophiala mesophila]|uniref:Protein kinase domain-containing protein n=1 Tax=Exophiala mesophila TaxID=212818 RepID=A0A438N6W8_EXOME|nr:hypothetical protein B0A52_05071 [Exophiala mesophila]
MELNLDGVDCPIIGYGSSGIVVLRNKTALKLPRSSYFGDDDDFDEEIIQREKKVYLRLGNCYGVVPYLDLTGPGIEMIWMENGNLRDYLAKHRVSPSVHLSWFREMARGLTNIHDCRVIVADISTRNFLLAKDMSIRYSDFTESSLLDINVDMRKADDKGYSIYTDIGQLGAVMFEVITGKKCDFDLFKGQPYGPATAAWPQREDLPGLKDVWLGSIIENCWTKGVFETSHALSVALMSATTP